jgi:hypothetical protein
MAKHRVEGQKTMLESRRAESSPSLTNGNNNVSNTFILQVLARQLVNPPGINFKTLENVGIIFLTHVIRQTES